MSCICPPGTKSSFSQSVSGVTGDVPIPIPDVGEDEYVRGVTVMLQYPVFCGQRFSPDGFVAPVRLYDAGFISFVQEGGYNLPELEIQWSSSYFFFPEGSTKVRVWINVGFSAEISFDVWKCPEEEEEEAPPPPLDF